MALGGDNDMGPRLSGKLASLYSRGDVLVFAASGNDQGLAMNWPAAFPAVISVGAVNSSRGWASFSNYNKDVELSAPGVGLGHGPAALSCLGQTFDIPLGTSLGTSFMLWVMRRHARAAAACVHAGRSVRMSRRPPAPARPTPLPACRSLGQPLRWYTTPPGHLHRLPSAQATVATAANATATMALKIDHQSRQCRGDGQGRLGRLRYRQ